MLCVQCKEKQAVVDQFCSYECEDLAFDAMWKEVIANDAPADFPEIEDSWLDMHMETII